DVTHEPPAAPVEAPTAPAPLETSPSAQTVVAPPGPPVQPAPPAPSAGPRLVFEDSGQEIKLPADKREIVIGREDPISGIHPEVDMTPHGGETGGVSRQHARITHSDGQWTITDLNSTNYTRVDGVKLDPNVPTPLRDGARVQLGRLTVLFRI
ncbi:MAG TPA: FHA domain-containing protein, partial [Roseiflexaceae bacterium]|nr:FHA domain-containing protein [Roseiflexaceae bacterium]